MGTEKNGLMLLCQTVPTQSERTHIANASSGMGSKWQGHSEAQEVRSLPLSMSTRQLPTCAWKTQLHLKGRRLGEPYSENHKCTVLADPYSILPGQLRHPQSTEKTCTIGEVL